MKRLEDLTTKELKIVFERNDKLQTEVFDDMFDSAHNWNIEYLECWNSKAVDYSIGWDRGTYFKCKDDDYFLDGLELAQRNYCFLADRWNETIEYTRKLKTILSDLECWGTSEINYERLENRIEELIEELETACYDRFMDEYKCCFEKEYQLDYFINFYVDERMDGEFYVDNDYILYEHIEQHIEYEKCYA